MRGSSFLCGLALVAMACDRPAPAPPNIPSHVPAAVKPGAPLATSSAPAPVEPPPFELRACTGIAAKLPRGYNVRTAVGAVSLFFESAKVDHASGRPGPSLHLHLAAFDVDGHERWRLSIGTLDTHKSPPWPLAVAKSGDILVAGAFDGALDTQPPLVSPPPSWDNNAIGYLLRVSSDGKIRHTKALSELSAGYVTGIAVSPDGDAIVGMSGTWLPHIADYQSVVARVGPTGEVVWKKTFKRLRGPSQLGPNEMVITSTDAAADADDGTRVVVLNATTGEIVREKRIPLAPFQMGVAGTSDGSVLLLPYGHPAEPTLDFAPRSSEMGVVFLDRDLAHEQTRVTHFSNGKELVTDPFGRAIVLHPGVFDAGARDDSFSRGPTFIEAHGTSIADFERVSGAPMPGPHVNLSFKPINTLSAPGSPGQGVSLCLDCSRSCANRGTCTGRGHECVATRDDDCRASLGCRESGLCANVGTACSAKSDRDCERSEACRQSGRCALVGDTCQPTTTAHCKASHACRDDSRCAFSAEAGCHALSKPTCRSLPACQSEGACHLVKTFGGGEACRVKSSRDCRQSRGCRDYGACHMKTSGIAQWCEIKDSADCAQSRGCREEGKCTIAHAYFPDSVIYTFCELTSDDDCRKTTACKRAGRCRLVGRACVK